MTGTFRDPHTEPECGLCNGDGKAFNSTCTACGGCGIDPHHANNAEAFDPFAFAHSKLYRVIARSKGPSLGMTDYVDARDIHPDWREFECWNCGHTERVGPNRKIKMCHECFMGQDESDLSGEHLSEHGHINYRTLWYGDVSIEEAKKQYEENTAKIRERIERERARERTVRL